MPSTESLLAEAESIAINRLIVIVRDSDSDHEARLAAESIFKLRRAMSEAPAPSVVAETPPAPTRATARSIPTDVALSTDELAELRIHLPYVKPERFTRKHTPAYWRGILAERRHRNPELAKATSPPQARAA